MGGTQSNTAKKNQAKGRALVNKGSRSAALSAASAASRKRLSISAAAARLPCKEKKGRRKEGKRRKEALEHQRGRRAVALQKRTKNGRRKVRKEK